MFAKHKWIYCLLLFGVCVPMLFGENKQTFSMPDSVLLLGTYNDLRIVMPDRVQNLRPPVNIKANEGEFNPPSISPHGDLIAWGIAGAVLSDPHVKRHARFKLGLYSIPSQQWKTYGDFDDIGATAFSPDGSKIVFVAEESGKQELLLFDVAAEKMTVWDKATFNWSPGGKASLGWAPDGNRLGIEIQNEGKSVIAVLDLNSGNVQIVGEGYEPAWSPTGEWIAYYAGQKCMLVHPDGTGTKTAKDLRANIVLHGYRSFNWGLVWSPEGKQLLLNEIKGDGPKLDVTLLDIASGHSSKKSENSLPVFGWIFQHKQATTSQADASGR